MIKIKELLINGVDYSDYATIPLQTQDTLDESLDMAYLELKGLENESPFVPFSDVYLKITDKDNNIKEMYMFIESDEVTHIIGINRYNHNILLIEETKWAERFFVEKTVTNPIFHNYVAGAKGADIYSFYDVKTDNSSVDLFMKENLDAGYVFSPARKNYSFILPHKLFIDQNPIDWQFYSGTLVITNPNGEKVTIELTNDGAEEITYDDIGQYEYFFHYNLRASTGITTDYAYYEFKFNVDVVEEAPKKEPKTIKDVIEVLLCTTETLRKSETPRFRLAELRDYIGKSENYLQKIEKIFNTPTPEFYFSKMSLFEALKTIGDYSHFIPRIKNRKIYLDLLGIEEKQQINDKYYSNIKTQNTNNFCTKLDSQVNNLINLDNEGQGSVTTPFNDGFRTLRTESGNVQITEQNMIIPTESPIEKIIKLEIGFVEGIDKEVGDITSYVYEDAEYQALSTYSSAFPYSKMYALKYTIGQNNITGLGFERPNATSQALENISIKNIINRVLNLGSSWWETLTDNKDAFKFQYRLTYIPNTSTRITQSKSYKENINKSISIAYNQGASKISSNAYGENLKGQILKMGNIEEQKMYIFPSIDLVPKCGLKFNDDYYISVVKCEYYPNFIKCELGLSKDYNNKSAYVEINSQLRFYEISEKSAYDSYRIYEDYCEIGFDSDTDKKSLITNDGINKFKECFNYGYAGNDLSMVKAISLDKDSKEIQISSTKNANYVLPVTSLGIGNSLLFEYHYKDNFSAGETIQEATNWEDKIVRLQEWCRYTDDYGEIEYLDLKYGINKTIPINRDEAILMGDKLPFAEAVTEMETYFDTGNDPIVLKKDNREAIHFTYQIHFVANNNNLIIGSGLTRYSTFVTNETMNYKLVLLKERLSKFESEIDLTNAYFYDSIKTIEDYENKKIKLSNVIAPENEEWKSWAIVQTILNDKNEIVKAILILGENKDIKSGDIIEMPNFVFKHKIVEE